MFRIKRLKYFLNPKTVLVLVVTILSQKICAQYNHYQFLFKSITIEDGLTNNKVNGISKDKYGFIWFATNDGVCRYDGMKVKSYYLDPLNTESANINHINTIYNDKDGELWIGAFSLFKYNYQVDSIVHYSPKDTVLKIGRVRAIVKEESGKLWIGSTNGLFSYHPDKDSLTHHTNGNNLKTKVISIFPDNDKLLLGTENDGLLVYNRNTGIISPSNLIKVSNDIENSIQCFFKDDKNILWAGTYSNGIFKINLNDSTISHIYPDSEDEVSFRVRKIIRDDNGHIWIGSRAGLFKIEKGTNQVYHYAHSQHNTSRLTDNSIYDIYIDNNQMMWLGTYAGGVNYTNLIGKQIYNFSKNENLKCSLSDNILYGFCEDENGNLYIGSNDGGLNFFDKQKDTFTAYLHDPKNLCSIGSNNVKGSVKDKSGNLWVGMYKDGVNYFDVRTKCFTKIAQLVKPGNKLQSNNVYSLVLDDEENLWIGSDRGIDLLNTRDRTIKPMLSKDKVLCLYKDHYSRIWAGVEDEGVFLFNPEKRVFLPVYKSAINCGIRTIHIDSNDNLWAGGNTGLIYVNTKDSSAINYTQSDGLPTNLIMGILEDESKNLWVSTSAGLVKCKDMVNHPDKFDIRIYTVQDGLQNKHFLNYSYYKSSSGEMFFGGIKGFSMFHPDSVRDNPYPPNIALTELKIFNKTIRSGQEVNGRVVLEKTLNQCKEIILSFKHRIFAIEFTALHYVSPDNVQYKYMMYPFEKGWNYSDASRPYATYTNLSGGKYIFKVLAANSDGLWVEEPRELIITVLSPFWKTKWFILSLALFIIVSFILVFITRVNAIQKQKTKLEMMVQERTRTITEMNDLLISKTKKLKKTNKTLEDQKDQITEQAEELETQKEELLLQKSMLENLNSMKDKFFSIIAHDLKGPFQGILGLTELLVKNYDECTNEEKKRYFEAIYNSSTNFYNLLENLLYWARTQLDHISTDKSEFDLVETINKNKQLFDEIRNKKKITLTENYDLNTFVFADINMIDTVIRNLLSNAIKFSHEGGHIEINISDNRHQKTIFVKDSGIGMTNRQQNSLFKIDRLDSRPGTSGEMGTGLGLILCYEFVTKNGGKIWVESTEGKGSVFYFSLPVHQQN